MLVYTDIEVLYGLQYMFHHLGKDHRYHTDELGKEVHENLEWGEEKTEWLFLIYSRGQNTTNGYLISPMYVNEVTFRGQKPPLKCC